ncbi:hypothetical protein [Aureimonas populi]|uniref:Uncharacterized protein n=1 Tax=Aureimonas populi TaxID=1701758 RepID=A0ABW5CMK5_9HYPH|nr:hypothetical protein [Aureimonas populi]
MFRSFAAGLGLFVSAAALAPVPAFADPEAAFFNNVVGRWTGAGEIVAGKYKGTRFSCDLAGNVPSTDVGMALDGSCRVGLFSQRMSAEINRRDGRLVGAFLDGAEGAGLDIVSGQLDGERMVFGLDRKQLNGAMVARLEGTDTMNVTVSVRVGEELVPVIGMNLKRDGAPVRQTALRN